jgi:tRNA 2-selenouridine synthase
VSTESDALRQIFFDEVPLLDVRAPVEFLKGAFPSAINMPLMDDAERQQVGTCYKERGQNAAIELGHRLVSGDIKTARIERWANFARAYPQGMLYCARGGLRSQIAQQWLATEAGIHFPRVQGGYKALRSCLLEVIEEVARENTFVVLSGLTGSGKTEVLGQLDSGIDLEGHANHRGSSFGSHLERQPSPISFENALALDFLRKQRAGHASWILEDEGRCIGACPIPLPLRQRMETAPIVWLEEAFELRVERILREYVIDLRAECELRWGADAGFGTFAGRLKGSLTKIQTRLGGERYQRLMELLDAALQSGSVDQAWSLHREWIAALLREYYDPMYRFQKDSRADRIAFSGDRRAVLGYLQSVARAGTP